MKIIHLSDLHLSTIFKESNLHKIDFALRTILAGEWDHIVITGDLTDNAEPNDFSQLRELFGSYGLLDPKKLSLVIGNHDIFGGIQTAEDILSFPERCKTTDYDLKICEFAEYFRETFANCIYQSENIFPYAKIIDDVLFVAINTIAKYSKIKNPFASNGEVDINQFTETDEILSKYGANAKTRIILSHHHFNKLKTTSPGSASGIWQNIEKQTMKLRKKKRLFRLFNMYNVDLVLHGHVHENVVYKRKSINFLNAGSSIKTSHNNHIKINVIDTDKRTLNTIIYNAKTAELVKTVPLSEEPVLNPSSRPVLNFN
jgi:3',5'-cyclic AMP phosphodiesterase CpdA